MIETLKYILLGLIQGVTEFLPISSSGHLVLTKYFIDLPQDLTLDVFLHLATLLAVVFYYRIRISDLIKSIYSDIKNKRILKPSYDTKYSYFILLASLPAATFGLLFNDYFDSLRDPKLVVIMLIIIAFYMVFTEFYARSNKKISSLSPLKALIIGIAQSLALIPGTSRSGMTITTAALFGFKKSDAADFSFLMSLPVIFGAFVVKFIDLPDYTYVLHANLWISFITALVSGYFSIVFLLKVLNKYGLAPFAVYRILAGVILLFILL